MEEVVVQEVVRRAATMAQAPSSPRRLGSSIFNEIARSFVRRTAAMA